MKNTTLLFTALLGLILSTAAIGCGPGSFGAMTPEQISGTEKPAKLVAQEKNLSTVATNQEMSTAASNEVSLAGTGKRVNFVVNYKFNSGSADSMKIVSTSRTTNCGCAECSDAKLSLISKTETKAVSLSKVSVEPNTDYTIEASMSAKKCVNSTFAFEPLVWMDKGTANGAPIVSTVCDGENAEQFTIVPMEKLIVTSVTSGKPVSKFCGETVSGDIVVSGFGTAPTGRPFYTVLNALGGYTAGGVVREYQLMFDTKAKTAGLTCGIRGAKTSHEQTLKNCRQVMLNFERLPKKSDYSAAGQPIIIGFF